MGAAVAVHESGRPGIVETISVLLLCAGLLVGLATLDDRAQRREAVRAQAVLSERAERAGERSSREAMTAPIATPARTDRLGRESSPIVIPAGPAWGPGTSVVTHTQRREDIAPQASLQDRALHRIVGPAAVAIHDAGTSGADEPVRSESEPKPAAKTSAAPTGPSAPGEGVGPVLLLLMAGAGLSMAGAGVNVLTRGRRDGAPQTV